jgi:regulator of PEP synthase PpsR (kinase-PPPase family)
MPKHCIHVVSDSSGQTAERVLRAAMLQFPQCEFELISHARVRTKERVEPILERVRKDDGLLVFSVVSPELNAHIHCRAAELRVEAVDVIGPAITSLASFVREDPLNRPGHLLPLTADYFRRIEAVEFTVRSDGGRDPRLFSKADLVLLGVSRTSKTPLSTLLAQRGLKVANLTIVCDSLPPAELDSVPDHRVVGLTIDADSLVEMRQVRLQKLGMPSETEYGVRRYVEREIAFAEKLFRDRGWSTVDMSGRSIEETAGLVLEAVAASDRVADASN